MTGFLLLIASIATGYAAFRFYRKRGYTRRMRWLGACSTGVLVLVFGILIFGPAGTAPRPDAVAQAKAAPAPTDAATVATAATVEQAPQYPAVDANGTAAAKRYIAELDLAIDHSVAVLPGIDLKTTAGISRHFHKLADEGDKAFGSDVRQLGYCSMAGHAADALWQSRIVGHEPTGADIERIQEALQDYQDERGWCLAQLKA